MAVIFAFAFDQVTDAEADALCTEYADVYEVAAELLPGGDRHDALRYSAKSSVALRHFIIDSGCRRPLPNFGTGGLQQLPRHGWRELMAMGVGFGGEGDWKTAVIGHALKAMAKGLPGGTSFMARFCNATQAATG